MRSFNFYHQFSIRMKMMTGQLLHPHQQQPLQNPQTQPQINIRKRLYLQKVIEGPTSTDGPVADSQDKATTMQTLNGIFQSLSLPRLHLRPHRLLHHHRLRHPHPGLRHAVLHHYQRHLHREMSSNQLTTRKKWRLRNMTKRSVLVYSKYIIIIHIIIIITQYNTIIVCIAFQ